MNPMTQTGESSWISDEWTESDHPVRFHVVSVDTADYDREWAAGGAYHVSVYVTSPQFAADKLGDAAASFGMTLDAFKALSDVEQHCRLQEYGVTACLWQKQGDDRDALVKEATEALGVITMFFVMYMDKPQNAIGDNGWDWIKGDLGAASRRRKEAAG